MLSQEPQRQVVTSVAKPLHSEHFNESESSNYHFERTKSFIPRHLCIGKPNSASNPNYLSASNAIRHHSLQVKGGVVQLEQTKSVSVPSAAEKETNENSSKAILKSELSNIRDFARCK